MFELVVYFILPLVGAILVLRKSFQIRNWMHVTGNIVGYEVTTMVGIVTGNRYVPVVVFRDERGESHTVKLQAEHASGYVAKLGAVKLIFPEGKPHAARVNVFFSLWGFPLFFFLPAVATLAFLGAEFLWNRLYG